MSGFRVPAGNGFSEITEKRSRFIGQLIPISDEETAKEFIRTVRKQYHDARHHCWCYRIHGGAERFSDDGEPQGSAGMPMLEVFRREEIFNFVCVVTRYFGGVLLGTGGLSRCYSGAAKEALNDAGVSVEGQWEELRLGCPYPLLERCRIELRSFGAEESAAVYGSNVIIDVRVPEGQTSALLHRLRELSSGKVGVLE